jgi:hypothetical protein
MALAAGLAVLAVAAGCELTTNTDGIVGTPPADAAPDVVSSDDGGGDAAAEAQQAPYCTSNPGHRFCADFDEGSLLGGMFWTTQYSRGGGTEKLDNSVFVSPPAAFLSTIPVQSTGGVQTAAGLVASSPGKMSAFHYSFAFRAGMDCFAAAGGYTFASITFYQSNIVGLVLLASGWFLIEQVAADAAPTSTSYALTPAPKPDTWHELRLDVSLGPGGHATVTLDTANALNTTAPYTPTQTNTYTLNAGVFATGPSGNCHADYDNMWFDFDP